jgi:hypothetical protein
MRGRWPEGPEGVAWSYLQPLSEAIAPSHESSLQPLSEAMATSASNPYGPPKERQLKTNSTRPPSPHERQPYGINNLISAQQDLVIPKP